MISCCSVVGGMARSLGHFFYPIRPDEPIKVIASHYRSIDIKRHLFSPDAVG